MDQRANNRKADVIRKIAARVDARQRQNRGELFWGDQNGVLGIKAQAEILALCLREQQAKHSKIWIGRRLFERMRHDLPSIHAKRLTSANAKIGLARRWEKGTFNNWLTNNGVKPDAADAQRVLNSLIELASENLVSPGHDAQQLKHDITNANRSVDSMVGTIVNRTVLGVNAKWTPAIEGYNPRIATSLAGVPEAAAPGPLLRVAKQAVDYLAEIDGPRLILLTGPAHSGKKTAIRYLVSELRAGHLRLADSTLLPTLALNLEELTADEFVEQVFAFYRSGSYMPFDRSTELLPVSAKVEQIRQMAQVTPACVILGEIGRVDADEIGRRLSGAYAEEIVSSLLEGHDLTRIVLASHDRSTGSFQRPKALLSSYTETIELPAQIRQSDLEKELSNQLQQLALPSGTLAGGLSWKLAHTALQLMDRRRLAEGDARALKEKLKEYLERDNPEHLMSAIVDLLDMRQCLVIGMVCSSLDGLRRSVLEKMLRAFRALTPGWTDADSPTGEALSQLIADVEMLIQGRQLATDRTLVEFGALAEETLFHANESWRCLFLAEWWRRAERHGKRVMLLIAREAADQSRWLRMRAGGRTPASIGRDVQALHALIASADFSLEGSMNAEADGLLCSEPHILPPLEVHEPVPSARNVFRYAFRQLYSCDLEGDDFRLLNVAEDARTRLRVLLTFLTPNSPWLQADERALSNDISLYGHLTSALTPSELVDLFASIGLAALRLQKFEILAHICRLGEQVYEATDDRIPLMLNLMRLLRAEIDAALLLGGNPDIYLRERAASEEGIAGSAVTRMTIADIVIQLNDLLDTVFAVQAEDDRPIDLLVARGKLYARLGEVLHAAGRLINAGLAFDKAIEIEAEVMKRLPPGSSQSPVMGGRGGRAFAAFSIDRARTKTYDALWSTFNFDDDLAIPIPRRIPLSDPDIARAMRSTELNARRLHNGRASEKVGVQIDGARMAVVDHQYARAFRLLDAANTTRFGSGSSLEILLELFAVKTRYLLDAAVICLNKNADNAIFASEDFMISLADYVAMQSPPTALELAVELLDRAEENLTTYARLALLHGSVMTPHVTNMRYLHALRSAIASRMASDPKELLKRANYQLEGVLKHLELSAFLMNWEEATRLKKGIENCLVRYP